jgi:signal transduction histidine kinase
LLDSFHRHAEAEENLRKAQAELEVRVKERTAELANANEALQAENTERKQTEKEVRSLAKFPAENPNPVLRIAQDGTLLYVNEAGLKLLVVWHLQVGQTAPSVLQEAVVQALKDGSSRTLDLEHRERVYSFVVAPIVDVGCANIYGQDITELKRTEQTLRQLSVRLLQTQDEERRRIARELHDATGQKLAALAINLSSIHQSAEALDPAARAVLTESLVLLDRIVQEVRTLSYLLHPPLLDERGLTSALRWYVEGFTQRSGIHVDVDVSPDLQRLPREVETAVFRIVQEGLTNAHRHSESATAAIQLCADQANVSLVVRDAGKGFPSRQADGAAMVGVGLVGMRERVKQLGGRMDIESGAGGTAIRVTLPLKGATP